MANRRQWLTGAGVGVVAAAVIMKPGCHRIEGVRDSKTLSVAKGKHQVCVYAIDPSGHGTNPTLKCSTVTVK